MEIQQVGWFVMYDVPNTKWIYIFKISFWCNFIMRTKTTTRGKKGVRRHVTCGLSWCGVKTIWLEAMTHLTRNWHDFQHVGRISSWMLKNLWLRSHGPSTLTWRHCSLCSGASSHGSKRSALKGLTGRLRCLAHRVLFVCKGSDATDPFLSSGLSANRVTAAGQHVKHTPLSSGSSMSLITMAAAHGWCHRDFTPL